MAREFGTRIALTPQFALELVKASSDGGLQVSIPSANQSFQALVLRIVQLQMGANERPIFHLTADGAMRAGLSEGPAAWPLILYSETGEEIERPLFREIAISFSQEKPTELNLLAKLQGEAASGEFHLKLQPAADQLSIEIVANITLLKPVGSIGAAPISSMFLFNDGMRAGFDDYRSGVHDSEGLWMRGGEGHVAWRSLNNPPLVANSYFTHSDPQAFAFVQRSRDFASYEDEHTSFENRPSLIVEPSDGWGDGFVRLVETPSTSEREQNVLASWIPRASIRTQTAAELSYKLTWTNSVGIEDQLAKVMRLAVGSGGFSGVEAEKASRKFVIDFQGNVLEPTNIPVGPLDAFVSVSPGTVEHVSIFGINPLGTVRLVIDAKIETPDPVELRAYLIAGGRQLTETWVYQWRARG